MTRGGVTLVGSNLKLNLEDPYGVVVSLLLDGPVYDGCILALESKIHD